MYDSYNRLAQLLCEIPEYVVEGRLNKNIVAELARKYDTGLINKLLSDGKIRKLFFAKSDAGLIFKKDIFLQFISQKEFLPDSYTAFEQKIGLASGGEMLRNDNRVVLNWPYKDCVLEGGQTKEDAKRDEVFFNEILAPDEINTLLEDKVFTNWKRYDKDGEHELDELKPDDNLIIKGNNLVVLHSLKKRFAGKVKLIYIDPPYNTGSDGFNYNDNFNHSTWLTFMKNRLEVAKSLLYNGCIAIQIDDKEQAYLKVLCDEIFGRENHLSTIVLKMATASGVKATHKTKTILKEKEYIHIYTVGDASINPEYVPTKEWDSEFSFCLLGKDTGQYKVVKLKDFLKENGIEYDPSSSEFNSFVTEHADIIWRRAFIRGRMKELSLKNPDQVIVSETNGGKYYYYGGRQMYFYADKIHEYFDENNKGTGPSNLLGDFWPDINTSRIFNEGGVVLQNGKKAEQIIARLIRMFTNQGDIVLDYYLGSGTTAAVAHKMGRQYIGIEQLHYGENDSVERLKNVIAGDSTGISKAYNWQGGGSFVYCNIKNDANTFREKVLYADEGKMDDLLNEVLHSSFLSYRIDAKNHNIKLSDFHKLSLRDKKRILLDLIDNNTLYLNYSEIDDETYQISDADKEHNKAFYGE